MKPAVEMGLRSQLGTQPYADEHTLGGLNMYSTSVDTIDPHVEHLAELFAQHASIALGRAQREEHLHDTHPRLLAQQHRDARRGSELIDQADRRS